VQYSVNLQNARCNNKYCSLCFQFTLILSISVSSHSFYLSLSPVTSSFLPFHYFCFFYFLFLIIFLFSHVHSTVPLTYSYLPAHLPSFIMISLISFLPSFLLLPTLYSVFLTSLTFVTYAVTPKDLVTVNKMCCKSLS
jgi:hypothetical protein